MEKNVTYLAITRSSIVRFSVMHNDYKDERCQILNSYETPYLAKYCVLLTAPITIVIEHFSRIETHKRRPIARHDGRAMGRPLYSVLWSIWPRHIESWLQYILGWDKADIERLVFLLPVLVIIFVSIPLRCICCVIIFRMIYSFLPLQQKIIWSHVIVVENIWRF